MDLEAVGAQLREAVNRLGPRSRGRRYPAGVRDQLRGWVVAARAHGMTWPRIEALLGIPAHTVQRWAAESSSRRPTSGKLRPVAILEEGARQRRPATLSSAVIRTPAGFTAELQGLGVDEIAALIRKLG